MESTRKPKARKPIADRPCLRRARGIPMTASAAEVEAAQKVIREHTIECTGLGEVSCRGCRDAGWMSWYRYHQHLAQAVANAVVAAAQPRIAAAEKERDEARADADEYDSILSRQGDLLTRTVNALRGDPPPLTSWSHHDVPELAQGLADRMAKVKALAAEHDHCSGCPTPWWLRAALADPDQKGRS